MQYAHDLYCHLRPAHIYNIFPHYLINGTIFGGKNAFKMCVLIFPSNFFWNISHPKNKWARCDKNVYWSSCKLPVMLVRFPRNLNSLNRFSKNIQISNFMKIRPVGTELFHADGQTDMKTWEFFWTLLKIVNFSQTVFMCSVFSESRATFVLYSINWLVFITEVKSKFRCFTVHFDSLSFIHTNSCTFSYNYVSVFYVILKSLKTL